MYDVVATCANNIVRGRARMMPVPGVQQQPDVRSTLFRKLEHVVHAPDKLVPPCLAKLQRAEELKSEPHIRVSQNACALAEPLFEAGAEFSGRRIARRHDVSHHARAVNGGSELSLVCQFRYTCFKGGVIFPELDREVDRKSVV